MEGCDSHLFIKQIGKSEGEIKCIAKNEEKYISFSKLIGQNKDKVELFDSLRKDMVTYFFKHIIDDNTYIWFDFSNKGYIVKKGEYSPYDLSNNKHLAIQNNKLYEPAIFKDRGLSYARFQNNKLNNTLINPHYENLLNMNFKMWICILRKVLIHFQI